MGLSRSRSITLLVALATLTSNTLSSLLSAQLPDDSFHLASNFGWYLHFANVLSVFGFIGALKQNALSITIFANYLLIDTLLCSIPRFLLLSLLNNFSSTLCSSPSSSSQYTPSSTLSSTTYKTHSTISNSQSSFFSTGKGEGQECISLFGLAQITLGAGVLAATVLQFVGALAVREYARGLWVKECREEILGVEGGLVGSGGLTGIDIVEGGLSRSVRGTGIRWADDESEKRRKEIFEEEWGFEGLPVIMEEDGDV